LDGTLSIMKSNVRNCVGLKSDLYELSEAHFRMKSDGTLSIMKSNVKKWVGSEIQLAGAREVQLEKGKSWKSLRNLGKELIERNLGNVRRLRGSVGICALGHIAGYNSDVWNHHESVRVNGNDSDCARTN
jgi:hypothetical protein